MKTKDIKKAIVGKSAEDLATMIADKANLLRTFYFGIAGSKVRNVREGRSLRRDIARMMTEKNK